MGTGHVAAPMAGAIQNSKTHQSDRIIQHPNLAVRYTDAFDFVICHLFSLHFTDNMISGQVNEEPDVQDPKHYSVYAQEESGKDKYAARHDPL